MHGTKAQLIMPGVWELKPERKLTDAERKEEINKLIALIDQKIADYQTLGGMQLKHGKRPTRVQKGIIKQNGLNPNNWLVIKNLSHENKLFIVNRNSGKVRVCPA